MELPEHPHEDVRGHAHIFEIKKDPEVQDKACRDNELAAGGVLRCRKQPPARIRHRRREEQQHDVLRVPAHVKIIRGCQQPEVSPPLRQHIVYQYDNWKKYNEMSRIK